jgi:hypothetical protein
VARRRGRALLVSGGAHLDRFVTPAGKVKTERGG